MNKDNCMGFGVGLLAGVIIGGAIALLYAPQAGKETREMIKDRASDVVDAVKERAGDVIDTVRDPASEASRRGQAAVKAIKS